MENSIENMHTDVRVERVKVTNLLIPPSTSKMLVEGNYFGNHPLFQAKLYSRSYNACQ